MYISRINMPTTIDLAHINLSIVTHLGHINTKNKVIEHQTIDKIRLLFKGPHMLVLTNVQ